MALETACIRAVFVSAVVKSNSCAYLSPKKPRGLYAYSVPRIVPDPPAISLTESVYARSVKNEGNNAVTADQIGSESSASTAPEYGYPRGLRENISALSRRPRVVNVHLQQEAYEKLTQ